MQRLSQDELRATQLMLLDTVLELCRDRDLRCYLYFGTLLGAVRHDGYIPWDDDIDLAMPRPDFERFCAIGADELPGGVSVLSPTTQPSFPYPFAKVAAPGTLLTEARNTGFETGVNIDVFPLDGWPAGRGAGRLHYRLVRGLLRVLDTQSLPDVPGRRAHKAVAIRAGRLLGRVLPQHRIVALINRFVTRYDYDTSAHVGVTSWAAQERVPRGAVSPGGTVGFEQRQCPAPADPDLVLRTQYGDYRTPPPPERRASPHEFTAYRIMTNPESERP